MRAITNHRILFWIGVHLFIYWKILLTLLKKLTVTVCVAVACSLTREIQIGWF